MASIGLGQEPGSGQVAEKMSVEAQKALAASIPRREAELANRLRVDVLVEVEIRAREMGVKASVEKLTDLLGQRAHIQIGLDKCRSSGTGSCRAEEKALARVEAAFLERAGLSTREFQAGRRETSTPAGKSEPQSLSKSQTCTCALSVFSGYRWMNNYWGLECGGHASHGVCSNDVDWSYPHDPGSGAMTGDINLYFGSYHQYRECPDDGTTCFHGPSTEHGGQWGNVCGCDTWHSQYYNPQGSFYGGDLSDSLWVHQVSTPYFTVAGSCNGANVSVTEYIQEHDPWCCDDPMGTLSISVPVADGSGNSPGQASFQNCNGGSQSGVYPYCGTFGATLWVAYICQTYGTPPPICDPQAAANCWDMGWSWIASTCSCRAPSGCDSLSATKMPYCP